MSENLTGSEGSGGAPAGRQVATKIDARLAEITDPAYTDPARKNLTGLDWLVFVGFFLVCAIGFVAWGY